MRNFSILTENKSEHNTLELPEAKRRLGIRPVGRHWWWCKTWRGFCQAWSRTSTSHSISYKQTHSNISGI